MSVDIEDREFTAGGQRISYRLHRSARRTLEIMVRPGGVVEVRAPAQSPIDLIESRVRARAGWIRRKVADRKSIVTEGTHRFTSGESHRYLGRQYRLRVLQGDQGQVRAHAGRLEVCVIDPGDHGAVRRALETWFRVRAREFIPRRVEAMVTAPGLRGVRPSAVVVRSMRTRWGSCSPSGRVLLNAELIHLPTTLIDYVVAHELCHLRVPKHGVAFERLMDGVLPGWRSRHSRLSTLSG